MDESRGGRSGHTWSPSAQCSCRQKSRKAGLRSGHRVEEFLPVMEEGLCSILSAGYDGAHLKPQHSGGSETQGLSLATY